MDQSSVIHDSSISLKVAIGFGVIGLILIILLIFCCCYRRNSQDRNNDRLSKSSSIESFSQLYFSKIPFDKITSLAQPTIERWSSVDHSSITFYRVYVQDNTDSFYQPVTEKRLHTTLEESKAMDYIGVEMNFF
ncbi:unnamed protein product [Rotaria magnacalcarata]|uniref:Uncharacterized protein n=1 Tax=Rotaria magnacalcarata TaxID=392030 RepID=A0A816B1L9_9BILA|nr:unnamed protein product [Rotaria magnacalcarata]CAF1602892.1 unnamed protein product [Rotaria magnacalcarata]CAF1923624.1 unnamed protein product [Rotaria magnacalcarata]CAF2009751.1 unnamed protein product [Rotaria magnacalcarata]CAF2075163.1 unnamed protein product [Rotaria magnacalcarata]